MMISTGLPELSSEKDLNYLRETLVCLGEQSYGEAQTNSSLCFVSGAGLHGGESSRTFPSEIQRSFG